MASKKRANPSSGSNSTEETEGEKKIPPKEIEAEKETPPNDSTKRENIKSMERRKKRKALDKERHFDDTDPKPQVSKSPSENPNPSPSTSSLPGLHINVFRDLASGDSSVRKAAAESLATELVEVQKSYERIGADKGVEEEGGVKLEAEKDDGLENCAPSLRYAIRRLIRGVSSSREMSTRVLPSKESKTKREVLVWTTHMDNVFIESMLFQHREGNHQDGIFSSCSYNDMLKDMNEKFPSMNIKRENLKNRLKTIKQVFSKCYDIFKSASNSGFAWNPESKKWEAEPEVWEILIQSKPEAAEWRTKSINKYDELEELFAKDRATGEGAEMAKEKKRRWAKTKANSVCEDNVNTVDGIDFLVSRNEINLEGFSGEFEGDNDDVEILPDVPSFQVPSQSGATSSKGKRRKNENMEEGLITSLDKIANAIERSTDAIFQSSTSLGRFRSRVISAEEITEALEEMGVEGQFYDDAFEFLNDNPEKAKRIFGYRKMGRLSYLEKLVYPTHGTS